MRSLLKKYVPLPLKNLFAFVKHRVLFTRTINIKSLNNLFRLHRYSYRATYADPRTMITCHNSDFTRSQAFLHSYDFATQLSKQDGEFWIAYFAQWVALQAARLPGDFVECGTWRGFTAAIIISSVDLQKLDKRLYLFDSWAGLQVEALTEKETAHYGKGLDSVNAVYSNLYDEVRSVFQPYPQVTLTRGFVPGSLSEVDISEVCFLHIDMNSVQPEVEALRFFWPKLVKGAFVLLDDYAWTGREEQKRGMDSLASELGFEIYTSPTGQGLIIK